jgi:Xaa-Pro aminopeptidase
MLYLSGFYDEPSERLLLLFVPQEGEPIFLAPALYADQIRQSSPVQDIRVWKDSDEPTVLLRRVLAELAPNEAGVLVDDTMWSMFLLMLETALPQADFSPASQVMVPLRMQKSPDELSHMRKASSIADEAFEEVSRMNFTGLTELQVAAALEQAMRQRGAEGVAFETLVASGPNSAMPHYRAGQRRIEPGDVVILDFGCRVQGYCSDITRTVVCQKPSKEIEAVYGIVRQAQERASQAIRPGVAAEEIDRAARSCITQAGYGERFIHRTGHGIGLEVHEGPYINEGNALQLQQGMTFSLEPGIYLPGKFGVRIEDIVTVGEKGAASLNHCTHELQVVE